MSADAVLATLRGEAEKMRAEVGRLNDAIAGIELAIESISGGRVAPEYHPPRRVTGRRLDKQAIPKTIEFVRSENAKDRSVDAGRLAREFKITRGAAWQRLFVAAKGGQIKRNGDGRYHYVGGGK